MIFCPALKVKYEKEEIRVGEDISEEEERILEVLEVSLKNIEEIYQQVKQKYTEISLVKVMELIMDLRMKKIISEENGYYFCNKIAVATGTV